MASGYPPDQTLHDVVAALNRAGVPYMVTGSFASSIHGEPRATQDLDVVIQPNPNSLSELLEAFPEDRYYLSHEAARQALADRGMFNIIEFATGWKIDLLICKDREFSRTEFERRQKKQVGDQAVVLASPEDVVLAKLEWAKAGNSNRQIEDAAAIVRTLGPDLDRRYITQWAASLGVAELWQQIDGD